jgi:hypothetical protein
VTFGRGLTVSVHQWSHGSERHKRPLQANGEQRDPSDELAPHGFKIPCASRRSNLPKSMDLKERRKIPLGRAADFLLPLPNAIPWLSTKYQPNRLRRPRYSAACRAVSYGSTWVRRRLKAIFESGLDPFRIID